MLKSFLKSMRVFESKKFSLNQSKEGFEFVCGVQLYS